MPAKYDHPASISERETDETISKTMKEISLVLLGFGSANRALVEMLLRKSVFHRHRRCLRITSASASTGDQRCIPWRVVAIVTGRHGRVYIPTTMNPEGVWYEVDVEAALRRIKSDGIMDNSLIVKIEKPDTDQKITRLQNKEQLVSQHDEFTTPQQTIKLLQALADAKAANIVAEAIPSNPRNGGGEPAVSFIHTALIAGMHVVSANKGPLAQLEHCIGPDSNTIRMEEVYWKLQDVAASNGVQYLHESAVMDGVPIFSLWQNTLPHANLTKLRGCLNATTTMILTRMEGPDGETFDEALSAAKEMGIVEADESLDIDGYDAAVKLRAILVVFLKSSQSAGTTLRIPSIDEIPRDSIRNVTKDDIKCAFNDGGKKFRLVASAGEY